MYSQIFVPTRRYHSSSRLEASPFRRRRREPSERIYMCVYVCVRSLFFPSPIRRWNSFRGPTPSATFDCFDYPYLIPPDSTLFFFFSFFLHSRFGTSDSSRHSLPTTPFLLVEIYRPGCRCPLPANRGWRWADSILFLVENCSIVRHWRGMMEWELERGRSVEK